MLSSLMFPDDMNILYDRFNSDQYHTDGKYDHSDNPDYFYP
jgi:hypothetical protein